jgi:adenosylcobinamide-GDP ribazoletransferase
MSIVGPERGNDAQGSSGSAWWVPLAAALAFLSVLPVPRHDRRPSDLGAASAHFPAVGAALGTAVGLLGLLLDRWLPPTAVAAVLVGLGALATGGLHLDGLMDTADGVFGGRDRELRLTIMRDSRVGAFGVVAGGLALLLPFAALVELTGTERLLALALAWGLGRWAMVLAIHAFPSARADGLGAAARASAGRLPLAVAATSTVAGSLALGSLGLVSSILATSIAFGCGRFLAVRLGGLTGDTYGAIAVIAETAVLYVAVGFDGSEIGA